MSATQRQKAASALLLAGAATLALYFVPYGHYVAWPFLIVSTLAHELGHGLTALALGGDFRALLIFADGSGVAVHAGSAGRGSRALVAAGGLLGPPLAAALLFLAGRRPRGARWALAISGVLLLTAVVLWVRTPFGAIFAGLLAALLLVLARHRNSGVAQFATVFLAIQLTLSAFSRSDYLFTPVAETSAGALPSDVAQIAQNLWLPYWFWGAAIAATSLVVLLGGLRAYLRAA